MHALISFVYFMCFMLNFVLISNSRDEGHAQKIKSSVTRLSHACRMGAA